MIATNQDYIERARRKIPPLVKRANKQISGATDRSGNRAWEKIYASFFFNSPNWRDHSESACSEHLIDSARWNLVQAYGSAIILGLERDALGNMHSQDLELLESIKEGNSRLAEQAKKYTNTFLYVSGAQRRNRRIDSLIRGEEPERYCGLSEVGTFEEEIEGLRAEIAKLS